MEWRMVWGAIYGVSLAALIACAILIFSNKISAYLSRRLLKKITRQSNQGVQS